MDEERANRYAGNCGRCGVRVAAGEGILETVNTNGDWLLWCKPCHDGRRSRHTGLVGGPQEAPPQERPARQGTVV